MTAPTGRPRGRPRKPITVTGPPGPEADRQIEAKVISDGEQSATVLNASDVPTEQVLQALSGAPWDYTDAPSRALVDALVTWTTRVAGGAGADRRKGTLFDRDRFVCPANPYDQMRVAYDAANDDVVAGYLYASEALAFSQIRMECSDEDEEDIWDQILEGLDIEDKLRQMWRELNIVSQIYVATWWGKKSFKIRGKSSHGITRKKTFNNLTVPLGITILDPLKVVPMGAFLFNAETLCYYAEPAEKDVIDSWLLGDDASGADPIIEQLIIAKYEPDFRDRKELGNMGVDPNRLYVLNPKNVFRHSLTRPDYSRFAPLRMRGIFELLDLKNQLHASDRALLMGAGNFIVLVKKGSEKEPAKQFEINQLQERVRSLGRTAVIVGDHRLEVEIVTPKTEDTLNEMKYSVVNMDIQAELWGLFHNQHAGRDDSLKLARVVARGVESQREMLKRSLMKRIFGPTFVLNDALTAWPELAMLPHRIALDFDPSLATYLLDLFDRGAISRRSILSEVNFDEQNEAIRRMDEIEKYDQIFPPPDIQWASEKMIGEGATWAPAPPPTDPNQDMNNQFGTKTTTQKTGSDGSKTTSVSVPHPLPGSPSDPKRAGKSLGGNHGRGGNGAKGRGAGQTQETNAPRSRARGPIVPPGSGATKGIRSEPKGPAKKPAPSDALDDFDPAEFTYEYDLLDGRHRADEFEQDF